MTNRARPELTARPRVCYGCGTFTEMAAPLATSAFFLTPGRPIRSLGVRIDGVYRGWWWFYGRPSEEAVCA